MTMEKVSFVMENSSAISSSAYWYPFSETGAPTQKNITEDFPLRSFVIENKSSQSITVILDPIAGSSSKEFQIPNGKTLSLENKDKVTFHQIAILNDGDLEIAISEIKTTVRNY